MNVYKSILSLIPEELRVRAFLVLVMMFLGMILEMLGVGLIIPVFSLILNADTLLEYSFFQYLISTSFITESIDVVFFSLFSLVFIYLFKVIYLSFLSWVQARFVFDLQANISNKLFSLYLKQPYSFYLKRNSSYLLRNLTIEAQQLVESSFLPLMLITNELVVIIGLVVLMVFLMPLKAMTLVGIVLLGGLFIYLRTKKTLTKWGYVRQWNDGLKIKTAQEGLIGIKDIKVLGREDEILRRFYKHVNTAANASASRNAVQQYPRIWIEFLGVISLILIIVIDLINGLKPVDVIPSVAFMAAIAFRIMPSANRFLSAIQSINFSTSVVKVVKEELLLKVPAVKDHRDNGIAFEKKIKIDDLSFSYDSSNPIIRNVSFEINKGQKVGIVGSSGAGKSTFVDLILGLHEPSSGGIKVDDVEITDNIGSWRSILGYVPQAIFLSDDTLRRNVAFGLPESEINNDDVKYAIKLAQLEGFVSELDDGVETIIGERGVRLSGGQRQRIGIARALYQRPKLLVLDEATSALDNQIEKEVMASIYSLDKSITILIIAHRLSTLDGCDEIITLVNGKLA